MLFAELFYWSGWEAITSFKVVLLAGEVATDVLVGVVVVGDAFSLKNPRNKHPILNFILDIEPPKPTQLRRLVHPKVIQQIVFEDQPQPLAIDPLGIDKPIVPIHRIDLNLRNGVGLVELQLVGHELPQADDLGVEVLLDDVVDGLSVVAALLEDLLAVAVLELGDLVFVGGGDQTDVGDQVLLEDTADCEVLVDLNHIEALELACDHEPVGLRVLGEVCIPAVQFSLVQLTYIPVHLPIMMSASSVIMMPRPSRLWSTSGHCCRLLRISMMEAGKSGRRLICCLLVLFILSMESQQPKQEEMYRCKSCRKVLFTEYIHHEKGCTSYFIEAPEWMPEEMKESNDSRLNCPKCKAKIGEVVFSGKKCNCQKWVTPGIQIHENKVDRMYAVL